MYAFPIKCFTCGMVIGNQYHHYKNRVTQIKNNQNQNQNDNNNNRVTYLTKEYLKSHRDPITNKIEKSVEGKVLEEMSIRRPCCKRHFLTHVY